MATSVWRGHISFGLVSIPVRLFRAARSERVKLRELYRVQPEAQPPPPPSRSMRVMPDLSIVPAPSETVVVPVRRAALLQESDEVVRSDALTKGFEIEKDRYVTLDREELKSLEPKTGTQMEILEFVHLAEVDPVYFEASYYVRPDEPGEQAYALLFEAMRQSALVGVAQFAMHRREHVVILRPGKSGIVAHTMYFEAEVRSDQEYRADASLVNPKNLELAKMLTESLAAKFEPGKYRDTYRQKLEALIEAKRGGEAVAVAGGAKPSSERVTDIADALRKSLAAMKKPAASAETQPRKQSKSRRRV